jgi:hypothetical protein
LHFKIPFKSQSLPEVKPGLEKLAGEFTVCPPETLLFNLLTLCQQTY